MRPVPYAHRPILLISGWGMPCCVFDDLATRLSAQRTVICLDLPGYGAQSSVLPYQLPQLAEAMLDAIDAPEFDLVGWSLGGALALSMAANSPARVKSLCLLATNPRFIADGSWPGVRAELLQDFSSALAGNVAQTLKRFTALQVQGDAKAKQALPMLRNALSAAAMPTIEVLTAGLQLLQNYDLRAELAALTCSVTLILGEADVLVPLTVVKHLLELQAELKVYQVPQAGHAFFLTAPQVVTAAILAASS